MLLLLHNAICCWHTKDLRPRKHGMVTCAPTPRLVEDVVGLQSLQVTVVMHTTAECENIGICWNSFFKHAWETLSSTHTCCGQKWATCKPVFISITGHQGWIAWPMHVAAGAVIYNRRCWGCIDSSWQLAKSAWMLQSHGCHCAGEYLIEGYVWLNVVHFVAYVFVWSENVLDDD